MADPKKKDDGDGRNTRDESEDAHGSHTTIVTERHGCDPRTVAIPTAVFALFIFALCFGAISLGSSYEMGHLEPARCEVTSHELLAWDTRGDGSPARCLPGLGVEFEAIDEGPDDGRRSVRLRAVARPTVVEDESWMDQRGKDAFYARHPVGASVGCFYKRDRRDFIAMSDKTTLLCRIWLPVAALSLAGAFHLTSVLHDDGGGRAFIARPDSARRGEREKASRERCTASSRKGRRRSAWRYALRAYTVCAACAFTGWVYGEINDEHYHHASVWPDMAAAECNITSHEPMPRPISTRLKNQTIRGELTPAQ